MRTGTITARLKTSLTSPFHSSLTGAPAVNH